jgi:putative addiction module component (TIGR02574 family)
MDFSEIARLSITQRIVLVDSIWESITADRRKTPLSEQDIEEMQDRIMAAEKKPSYMSQWEKMKNIRGKKKL